MSLADYMRRSDMLLNEIIESGRPVVILGGGGRAKAAKKFLREHSIEVDAFCEGREYYKPGREVEGKPVCEWGNIPARLARCNLVIAATESWPGDMDVTFPVIFPDKNIGKIYVFHPISPNGGPCLFDPFAAAVKQRLENIVFEVDIAEHCNLNCAACSHFSPIAEPEFLDVEEFRRDMERMGILFAHEGSIGFLGGEPLLHPEIIFLMKIARENFSHGNIAMSTNGILLPQKEEAFWQACHDNNVKILISAYPIKIDIASIRSLAQKFDVKVDWAFGQEEFQRNIFNAGNINLDGDGNMSLNFYCCVEPNHCVSLRHGRLYVCGFGNHVRHFNKKFGQNIPVTEADYIDIYQDIDKAEIFQRLSEPIPLCRYCTKALPARTIKWRISTGDISEWVYQPRKEA